MVGKTHNIDSNATFELVQLLNQKDIEAFQEEFNYIHIGLVQVRVNPLTRLALNMPICLALWDARHLNFEDSITIRNS